MKNVQENKRRKLGKPPNIVIVLSVFLIPIFIFVVFQYIPKKVINFDN
ncbi:hypothetical protein [Caminicella sporogenes]|nr:hypothetical protein [Caminicella sporogenes]WIF94866.1 hypothetical protein QNI18_11480 [Caminicella sporogenes]